MESWYFDRKKLTDAMTAAGMNMSNVASVVWGTSKDSRGVRVARNRDRIRAYLAGSGATHDNFAKIAAALGVGVDDLRAAPPAKPDKLTHPSSARSTKPTSIIMPLPGGGEIEITVRIIPPR